MWLTSHMAHKDVDVAALIAAHVAPDACEKLAESIRRGEHHTQPFPVQRPVPGPTSKDEAVGGLLRAYQKLVKS